MLFISLFTLQVLDCLSDFAGNRVVKHGGTTALRNLSQDASDFLGRSISRSALIRALIRQVVKPGPLAADALFIEVERELKAGVRWGKQE